VKHRLALLVVNGVDVAWRCVDCQRRLRTGSRDGRDVRWWTEPGGEVFQEQPDPPCGRPRGGGGGGGPRAVDQTSVDDDAYQRLGSISDDDIRAALAQGHAARCAAEDAFTPPSVSCRIRFR
jgi:hypothetical protein